MLISDTGDALLADIALSSPVVPDKTYMVTHSFFTVRYAAPELVLADVSASPRYLSGEMCSDIYAFGMLVYEVCTLGGENSRFITLNHRFCQAESPGMV